MVIVRRFVLAAILLAVVLLVSVSLPPAKLTLGRRFSDQTVRGILHVHTVRSDGSGTPDEVAAAAARAGVAFVIFTDHGDATRPPDPPLYRSGVLCIDAVEISTSGGHYIALDMPAAPYPLAGEPRDVVEDIRRLGGFGVAAHPNSPKADLAWNDWTAPFDALEWLNLDTSWRVKMRAAGWRSRWHLIEAVAAYPFRPAEVIARLTTGTGLDSARWSSLSRARKVVMLAGADAHARLGFGSGDKGVSLSLPGYTSSFFAMSLHVAPERGLTGDAALDAAAIVAAIRRGRAYTVVDGLAGPSAFRFTATNARGGSSYGDTLEAGGPVTLSVTSNAPPSFTTVLLQDERPLASVPGNVELTKSVSDSPAVYRVEIYAPVRGGATAWLVSNPIYAGLTFPPAAPPREARPVAASQPFFDGRSTEGWRIEADPASRGTLDVLSGARGQELTLRYWLAGRPAVSPYVAFVGGPVTASGMVDQVSFTASADRPGRVSVVVRSRQGEQFARSAYLDQMPSEHVIPLDEMTPVGETRSPRPVAANIADVLFVIETTHTRPGSVGSLRIAGAALQVRE